jgi:predicted transposase/invertase (TIGR01784 family)
MNKEPLSPKNDFVFKQLFGEQKRLNLLQSFLQSVLDLPKEEYSQLVVIDPFLKREHLTDKSSVLDVKIHTTNGKVIDVEIQVDSQDDMWERVLYYTAKMTTEQLKSGYDYDLIKKVISIIILDWPMTGQESTAYHHRFRLFDERTGYRFPDLFEINTLELPKLPRQSDGTDLYNWLRIFTAKTEEEFTMIAKTSPEISQAVGVIMELSEDEQTRLQAEAREKYRRDEAARRKLARREGRDEGIQIGRQEGLLEVAKQLLIGKDSVEKVAKVTGLSLEEVQSLAAKLSVMN